MEHFKILPLQNSLEAQWSHIVFPYQNYLFLPLQCSHQKDSQTSNLFFINGIVKNNE